MMHNRKLNDEAGRLAALRKYDILDTAPEEPFDKLTELVRNVLNVPIAAVSMIDADRQWFKSIVGLSTCETSREISFCSYAIKQRKPLMVPDARLDVRFAKNPMVNEAPWIRSYLGIPLETSDGYNVGALCAIDTKERVFSSNDIALLSSFAKLVLNELELRQLAMSDGLTGAMTRRAWVQAAEKELALSRRHGVASSIILFDIDNFKQLNDAHGHSAGDAVLRTLAQRCCAALRESDMLGRIGGEEFALLLPATDAESATDLAVRLCHLFADTPVEVNGTAVTVTASFGIRSLDSSLAGVDEWLTAADAFLYEAKANGRNRCCGGIERKTDTCL